MADIKSIIVQIELSVNSSNSYFEFLYEKFLHVIEILEPILVDCVFLKKFHSPK